MREKAQYILKLVKLLNQYRHEYYNMNNPSVTDAEYDKLYDQLVELEKETGIILSDSPTQTVGYRAVSSLGKVKHTRPLLSLDKTKSLQEIVDFMGDKECLISIKYDGLTVKIEYENGELFRASTRGDGDIGEDITHNVRAFKNVPLYIPIKQNLTIVGEAIINYADFERIVSELPEDEAYKHPRNLAAGSARLLDAEICSERNISFMPFNVLEGFNDIEQAKNSKCHKLSLLSSLGFDISLSALTQNISAEELESKFESFKITAQDMGIPIDGIVITYNEIAYSESLGRTGHHYKDGLAFKFEDTSYETKLVDIEWNTSRTGVITPVAIFEPVEINGSSVSRATIHNLAILESLQLFIGCRILVSLRNMIIPHIEDNLDKGNGTYALPVTCPSCGGEAAIRIASETKILECLNPACEAKAIQRLIHFASKKAMDFYGLSDATIATFYQYGFIERVTDFYRLEQFKEEIISLPNFGDISYQKLIKSIKDSTKTTFQRLLVSVDIPLVGSTASKILLDYFYGDSELFYETAKEGYDFSDIEGIGPVISRNINEWFKDENNIKLWKELLTLVQIDNGDNKEAENSGVGSEFKGLKVVITGKFSISSRSEISNMLIAQGATVVSAVSSKTDLLLVGADPGSKLDKAKALGVRIMYEEEFEAKMNMN